MGMGAWLVSCPLPPLEEVRRPVRRPPLAGRMVLDQGGQEWPEWVLGVVGDQGRQ